MFSRLSRVARQLEAVRGRFGTRAASVELIQRVFERPLNLTVIKVVWLDRESCQLPSSNLTKYDFRFISAEEIRRFAAEPELGLSEELAERIQAGTDMCFGAIDNGRLVAYGWYAFDCIEGEHNFGIAMSYPEHVAYMYKGFTHPDYRGQRLHGLGMGLAFNALGEHGVSNLVSTVDWTNAASLRSCRRIGYQDLGLAITAGPQSYRFERFLPTGRSNGIVLGRYARTRTRFTERVSAATVV